MAENTRLEDRSRQGSVSTYREIFEHTRDTKKEIKELVENLEDLGELDERRAEMMRDYLEGLDSVSDHWEDINRKFKEYKDLSIEVRYEARELQGIAHGILEELRGPVSTLNLYKRLLGNFESSARKINEALEYQGGLQEKNLVRMTNAARRSADALQTEVEILKAGRSFNDAIKDTEKDIGRLYEKLDSLKGKKGADIQNLRTSLRNQIREKEGAREILVAGRDGLPKQIVDRAIETKDIARKENNAVRRGAYSLAKKVGLYDLADDIEGQSQENSKIELRKISLQLDVKNAEKELRNFNRKLKKDTEYKTSLELVKTIEGNGFENLSEEDFQAYSKAKDYVDQQNGIQSILKSNVKSTKEELKGIEKVQKGNLSQLLLSADVLKGIAGIIALKIWNSFKAVNEEAAELKRRVGSWEMGTAAVNNQLATSVDWLKAATELSDQTGLNTVTLFSPDDIARMAELKNLTGMSAQEAGNLAIRSKLAGVGMDQYRDALTEGANKGNALNHSVVTLKEVQEGVLKASDATSLSYGNNAKALGQAVVAAKNLGMELAGIENISKQLISFESSISAEMEAQLLTGQRLNLAKAREYALNNDLEGVANEIQKQGVNAAKFSHMNLIQQEAMAKALGMSREELAKSLVLRELNNGASKEAIAAATGMEKKQIEALSVQQNWKILLDKITQAFAPILEVLVDIMKPVSWILAGLGKIIGWISQGVGWVLRFFGTIGKGEHDVGRQVTLWQKIVGGIITATGALIGLNRTLKGTSLLSKGLAATWKGIQAVKTGVVGGVKGIGNLITRPGAVLGAAKIKAASVSGSVTGGVNAATQAANSAGKANVGGLSRLSDGLKKFFAKLKGIKIDWSTLGKIALAGAILAGTVALLGLSFRTLKVDKASMQGFAWAVGILSASLITLGLILIGSGGIGAAALAGGAALLAGTVVALGLAFKVLSGVNWEGIKSSKESLKSFAEGLKSLVGIKVSNLNPISRALKRIGKAGEGITAAASGVSLLARSIISLSASIETLDVEKLNSLNNVKLGKISRAANRIESAKIKEGSKETKESESIRPATRESIETTADLKDIKNTLKELTKLVETIDPQWDWVKFRQAEVKFFND